ncbi:hypothetical protein [Algoriphagus sediminis]|uniref:ABC transporter permease n=1 Tax=Algoriphagus sediminis TaxID=3057113 RepID=A0ABT7YCD0_9BACT|nr:hypothetical protein [Algoriphagus sediminis]MDN3203834.1 hypothetical protein [Algoriphagus sediminis]
MKLRTFKIWLILLPLILLLGVILFIQSTNNQKELESQLMRSVNASRNDAVRALDDYYSQVDSYFLRKGYSFFDTDPVMKTMASRLVGIFKASDPEYSNLSFAKPEKPSELILTDEGLKKISFELSLNASQVNDFSQQGLRMSLGAKNNIFQAEESQAYMDLNIPFEALFRKQESNRQFDLLVITDDSGKIVYPTTSKGVSLLSPKPILDDSLSTRSGSYIEQINFSNREYKSFIAPLNLENLNLYVVGMFEEGQFQKVGLRVNFLTLAILIFILIVLLSSIPILSILNLSKGDRLSQAKVINVGISLVGLALVMGFASSFFRNLPVSRDFLGSIVNDVAITFQKGITSQAATLSEKDANTNSIPKSEIVNEYLLITLCPNDNPVHLIEKFVFNGDKIDPVDFSQAETKSFIDISDREYANYYSSSNDESKTYLGAHYSRGSGGLESVISSKINDGYLKAITFNFSEVINAFYPQSASSLSSDYRFLLFKENGKILFKSEKIDIPISYLNEGLNEIKWTQLQSILRSNSDLNLNQELEIDLYLNGYQYTGILKLIDSEKFDEKVWMVFLVNENLTHVFSSLTSLESFSFLGIYFIFLFVILVVQRLSIQSISDKGFKVFLYNWLKPSDQNSLKMVYLSITMLFLGLGITIIFYLVEINHLAFVTFCCFCAVLVALLNYLINFLISGESILTKLKSVDTAQIPIFLMGILLVSLSLLGVTVFNAPSWIFIGFFLINIALAALWTLVQKRWQKGIISGTRVLPFYLAIWFIVIGFLPGYMIQSKVQLFEAEIWKNEVIANEEDSPIQFQEYEKFRRKMLGGVSDLFDRQIQSFIAPNAFTFGEKLNQGIKPMPKLPGIVAVLVGILLAAIGFIFFIRIIQDSIFFRFGNQMSSLGSIPKHQLSFYTCLDSDVLDSKLQDAIMVNMLADPNLEELKSIQWNRTYYLKNFHTQENYVNSIFLIQELKSHIVAKNCKLVISSGMNWKEIFALLKEERDRVAFSEVFSDFYFDFAPLKPENSESNESLANESLFQKLRNRKSFYANIWSELNFEEKLACHSFAVEGFFNPAQQDTLSSLKQKGVVIPKKEDKSSLKSGSNSWREWQLFSPMFRKYILVHVTEDELKKFKRFEKRLGNSNLIQISTVSFVLICFALIGIFDRNFFNEAYAYLTGSIGLLGSLYALLNQGLVGLKFGKSES